MPRRYRWEFVLSAVLVALASVGAESPRRVSTVPVAPDPAAIALNPLTDEAFVISGRGALTIVDGRTLETTQIPIDSGDPSSVSLAVDPKSDRVFISNVGTVSVFEHGTGETRVVPVSPYPGRPVVDIGTQKVYVPHPYYWGPRLAIGHTISVLDEASLEVQEVETGFRPTAIAIDEPRNAIYVALGGDVSVESRTMSILDGATNARTDVMVGNAPTSVAVDPGRGLVVVANFGGAWGSASISLVEEDSLEVFDVPVTGYPVEVVVNEATGKAYVATISPDRLFELDEQTHFMRDIPVPARVTRLAVDSARNRIYALHAGESPSYGNTVTLIDGATLESVAVVVGTQPVDIAVDSARDTAWVINDGDGTVSVIYGEFAPCGRCPRTIPLR